MRRSAAPMARGRLHVLQTSLPLRMPTPGSRRCSCCDASASNCDIVFRMRHVGSAARRSVHHQQSRPQSDLPGASSGSPSPVPTRRGRWRRRGQRGGPRWSEALRPQERAGKGNAMSKNGAVEITAPRRGQAPRSRRACACRSPRSGTAKITLEVSILEVGIEHRGWLARGAVSTTARVYVYTCLSNCGAAVANAWTSRRSSPQTPWLFAMWIDAPRPIKASIHIYPRGG